MRINFTISSYRNRAPNEVENARQQNDCLLRFRARVRQAGDMDAHFDDIDKEVLSLIEDAVAQAKKAPAPAPADVLTDVYASY